MVDSRHLRRIIGQLEDVLHQLRVAAEGQAPQLPRGWSPITPQEQKRRVKAGKCLCCGQVKAGKYVRGLCSSCTTIRSRCKQQGQLTDDFLSESGLLLPVGPLGRPPSYEQGGGQEKANDAAADVAAAIDRVVSRLQKPRKKGPRGKAH